MEFMVQRHPATLKREKTALLIIDIQERIINAMFSPQEVLANTIKLIKGFKVMNIPVFITEQYPKGLGTTASEIKAELGDAEPVQKMTFSCSGAGELFLNLKIRNIDQVAVCGIESHVCVQQTVLDLLANGFQVDVAADAVSSRKEKDYETALQRMRSHGAEITTTESILFELLNVCGTDEFKQVSKIVK